MKLKTCLWVGIILVGSTSGYVCAGCEIVDGDKKTPFDGRSLGQIPVEKKSLIPLNTEFPNLNVIEKTFKGEIQTCTNCAERHVACTR